MDKLNKYGYNITSQHGEDGILNYIISSINEFSDEKINKIVCEFGAWDGIFASNTYTLWHDNHYEAYLIEADEKKFNELLHNTANYPKVKCFNYFVQSTGTNSLDDIFISNQIEPNIGVLSIDVDSIDYHILANLSYVKPQIIVIEHNQHIPPHIEYYDPEGYVYLKCSAKSIEKWGMGAGYRMICCTKTNSILIKESLFNEKYFPNLGVESLFDYSEIKPILIFTGEQGNKYPIYSKKHHLLQNF